MKALKLFGTAALAAVVFTFASAANAQTYPNSAQAISLKNAINNNSQAMRDLPGNSATITTYLPLMGICQPPFTTAKTQMEGELAYVAGGGTNVTIINGYISQVNNALAAATACFVEHTPVEVFSANAVKYSIYGFPSNSYISTVTTRINNMPAALKAKVLAASTAGWKFYIIRSADDFAASPLASLPGVTSTYINNIRKVGAFTDKNLKIQVFFEAYNPYWTTPAGNQNNYQYSVLSGTNISAAVAHENEHLNDFRLGSPSQLTAFTNAYNAGVTAYNAAPASKDPDIAVNFIRNTANGGAPVSKEELFAELAAYWDTAHWGVGGQTASMASKAYLPADVVTYFSAAWTLMQTNKGNGTW